MNNVIGKVSLIIVIILIALFAYKSIRSPSLVSATVAINSEERKELAEKIDIEKTEKIIKEYLLNNPEIIIQSIEGLQQRKIHEMEEKTDQYVKDNKATIEDPLNSPILGNPNGDIIMVTFYDYNCGYCKKGDNFVERLVKLDNGVKVILKPFPILGDSSNYAASVALAVFKIAPEKFSNIHAGLIAMKPITPESVGKLLIANNLDPANIINEIDKAEIRDIISKNIKLASDLRIQGVPAYIINGKLIPGMFDLEQLKKMIADIRSKK